VDTEAARVRARGIDGAEKLLREAWQRLQLPIAVTEVHNGCTREEQLRWLKEVWDAAEGARAEGVDVRAVTAWAMLGSYDWNSLLTCSSGHYEPGVFDLRAPRPRPTALAQMLCDLAAGLEPDHPVLDTPGWWRRLERLIYPPVRRRPHRTARLVRGVNMKGEGARPLLITGATGTLGRALARICEARGIAYRLFSRGEMEIADPASVEAALEGIGPWAIVNAAGYVRVDEAEREPKLCRRENTVGPVVLASACKRRRIALLTFSSDLVFDGAKGEPYTESDQTVPLNVYGQSKREAEERVLGELPHALVIRTSAFFGPCDEYNFITVMLRTLAEGDTFRAADDAFVSPTYVPDLAHASLDLLIDGERGLWHLANAGAVTWANLARLAAERAGLDPSLIEAVQTRELNLTAPRPPYSVLGSERGVLLPSLDNAISRYFEECEIPAARQRKEKFYGTGQQAQSL
jgi:dTDP-4-dehydrorhamnose reductase